MTKSSVLKDELLQLSDVAKESGVTIEYIIKNKMIRIHPNYVIPDEQLEYTEDFCP
ncbi:hypothetical protein [Candidatus Liberibacter solanacearum]|uniref:hypothetical protein n=1 Tax=Candidatus Liberibacter solanacearum TaxID=556287 RepID=UPI000A7A237E|nr:hypothetical protein [Candidatus Liberibacter solanacearum]